MRFPEDKISRNLTDFLTKNSFLSPATARRQNVKRNTASALMREFSAARGVIA